MASELLDHPEPEHARACDLEITLQPEATGMVLLVAGEIDIASVGTLTTCLDHVLADSFESIVVDLAAVTFMDSTGLAALAAAQRRLAGSRELGVRNASPSVLRTFTMTGLDSLIVDDHVS